MRMRAPILFLFCSLLWLAGQNLYAQSAPAEEDNWEYKAIGRGVVEVEGGIIELSAQRDGIIMQVMAEEGDKVEKGQILAIQDDRVAARNLELSEEDIKQRQAQLEVTKARRRSILNRMRRLKPLVEIEAEPLRVYQELQDSLNEIEKELKLSKVSVRIAQKQVETARSDLEQFKIRAPLDGTIARKFARPGLGASSLNISTLFWLVPNRPKQVRLLLESKYYDDVSSGDKTFIYKASDPSKSYLGYVQKTSRVLASKTSSLEGMTNPYEQKYFECIIAFAEETSLLIGQNVIVKFIK